MHSYVFKFWALFVRFPSVTNQSSSFTSCWKRGGMRKCKILARTLCVLKTFNDWIHCSCRVMISLFITLNPPQMHKLCSELKMIESCCRAKRDKLMETLKWWPVNHSKWLHYQASWCLLMVIRGLNEIKYALKLFFRQGLLWRCSFCVCQLTWDTFICLFSVKRSGWRRRKRCWLQLLIVFKNSKWRTRNYHPTGRCDGTFTLDQKQWRQYIEAAAGYRKYCI